MDPRLRGDDDYCGLGGNVPSADFARAADCEMLQRNAFPSRSNAIDSNRTPTLNTRASASSSTPSILVCGGGIGGLAAALALAQEGVRVKVLEQAQELGEIGAGVQLGPNAFSAFDALGIGESARARAVYTERLLLLDAIDASQVAEIPVGAAFRARFGNPYAVVHRTDVHLSLLEGVREPS